MNSSSLPQVRWRLAQVASHLVVALIALVVVGGATRVMEAGLACPDWPLCYGSFLPGRQMNVQVFLEWFHRLDAFVVGIALILQFLAALIFRSELPKWLLWLYGSLILLVAFQAGLGALTVIQLLPSGIVTAHLILALTLVALMSGISQKLLQTNQTNAPIWWRIMGSTSVVLVMVQALLGGRMATQWASKTCLTQDIGCNLLDNHRLFAIPITAFIVVFLITALFAGGWPRTQWPFLLIVLGIVCFQITLGITSVRLGLSEPLVTISHQLFGALLVALLSALTVKQPITSDVMNVKNSDQSLMEACHG